MYLCLSSIAMNMSLPKYVFAICSTDLYTFLLVNWQKWTNDIKWLYNGASIILCRPIVIPLPAGFRQHDIYIYIYLYVSACDYMHANYRICKCLNLPILNQVRTERDLLQSSSQSCILCLLSIALFGSGVKPKQDTEWMIKAQGCMIWQPTKEGVGRCGSDKQINTYYWCSDSL